jgi:2-keto-4-pentenoate hydratase/2-oxohepta-3-ene-1,7-dioic acid hydratase in catechol pathway
VRLATIVEDGRAMLAVVRDHGLLPVPAVDAGFESVASLAAGGPPALARLRAWQDRQPASADRSLAVAELGPALPAPGAIYTIGLNYRSPTDRDEGRPERPLVYGKLSTSVAGPDAVLAWDRSLTPNVDPEVELGVVIGDEAIAVDPGTAMRHVFGYTCVNDVSSRDPWLDGDQWLLGKSMAGFCPVGPWIVTSDELDPSDLRLGCRLNGRALQEGTTAQMLFSIAEIIAYLSRHTVLRPGDLIATGTPPRLAAPPGPDRHLEPGDNVTVWVAGIGELSTTIA